MKLILESKLMQADSRVCVPTFNWHRRPHTASKIDSDTVLQAGSFGKGVYDEGFPASMVSTNVSQ